MAVYGHNFIVDIQGLWSPGLDYGIISRHLDPVDEDVVDEYVANNPVPEDYVASMAVSSYFWSNDRKYRGRYARRKYDGKINYTTKNNQTKKSNNCGRYAL